jgi:hypothetical protein
MLFPGEAAPCHNINPKKKITKVVIAAITRSLLNSDMQNRQMSLPKTFKKR